MLSGRKAQWLRDSSLLMQVCYQKVSVSQKTAGQLTQWSLWDLPSQISFKEVPVMNNILFKETGIDKNTHLFRHLGGARIVHAINCSYIKEGILRVALLLTNSIRRR